MISEFRPAALPISLVTRLAPVEVRNVPEGGDSTPDPVPNPGPEPEPVPEQDPTRGPTPDGQPTPLPAPETEPPPQPIPMKALVRPTSPDVTDW